MGVDQFFRIIVSKEDKTTIGSLGTKIKLQELKGARICVDASGIIYSSILALENITALTDTQGKPTAHINIILNKVIQLKQAEIDQIWIFDSPHPNEMKRRAIERRALRRAKERSKSQANEKVIYQLTTEHVQDIQKLLRLMGIMFITAPEGIEAEQYGAYMTRGPIETRFCRYMLSSDSDVLCFGGNLLRITTEKSATGASRKTVYCIYELDDILQHLQFSYEQFLRMCVTMGTDFNDKTVGIGPATIVTKIRAKNVYITPAQESAIEYFMSNIHAQASSAEVTHENYNADALIEFLLERNFQLDRVTKMLQKFHPDLSDDHHTIIS
jgi:flap endonuclease-1